MYALYFKQNQTVLKTIDEIPRLAGSEGVGLSFFWAEPLRPCWGPPGPPLLDPQEIFECIISKNAKDCTRIYNK